MTTESYYRGSLALPIVLPLLAFGAVKLIGGQGYHGVFDGIANFLMDSLALGGVPYLYTVFRLLTLMADPEHPVDPAKLAWSAPIRMLPPCLICWSILTVVLAISASGTTPILRNLAWGATMIGILSAFVLLLGYGYVVLTLLGMGIFRALGWVTD